MKSDTTRAMQDALDAAVRSMNASVEGGNNGSNTEAPSPPSRSFDTIGAIMTILPKILQGSEVGEEVIEKLESLQKGELAALGEQIRGLRVQCQRMLKSQQQLFRFQEEILGEMRELQRNQAATSAAVGELAHHMSRVEILDPLLDEPEPPARPAPAEGRGPGRPEQGNDHRKAQEGPRSTSVRARP
jgi:hypothetical protein